MTVSLVQWRALIGIFDFQISGTSTNNRYNLIINFVSVLENLLLFYHYLEGVYITVITLLYNFGYIILPWRYWTNLRSKEIGIRIAIGILIVYLLISSWNLHRKKYIFQYINTISYVCQKHTWFLQHLMVWLK